MPASRQQQVAEKTVQLARHLADPGGLIAQEYREPLLARVVSDRPTHQSGTTSKLNLTGLHGDASQFDALVSAVDFPTFVAGLIEGVFGAIVNASIEQMHAYKRLLASVAKTVEQLLKAGIDNTVARDALMQEFAGILCWQGSQAASGRGRRLVLCPHAKRASLVRIPVRHLRLAPRG